MEAVSLQRKCLPISSSLLVKSSWCSDNAFGSKAWEPSRAAVAGSGVGGDCGPTDWHPAFSVTVSPPGENRG